MDTLTTQGLERLKEDSPKTPIINTLPSSEFDKKHIPDSINIPVSAEDFVDRVEEQLESKSDPVVVYCANQKCDASAQAAKLLDEAGFENVYDYEGGMQDWEDEGKPVAQGSAA